MIAANNLSRIWETYKEEILSVVQVVGARGLHILGPEVQELEKELPAVFDTRHCRACGNGMDGLEIALRALDIAAGDRVLTTPLSAFATTLAIHRAGGVPEFVDVDSSGLLDLDLCEERLRKDPRIKFLLPVHLYGHALDMDKLEKLRDTFGVVIVEDCAQAIGARFNGRSVGTAGQASATSFYPTKNLGSFGDGGAVLSSDVRVAELAGQIRDYGQRAKYEHLRAGMNSRMDEIQAGILRRVFLPRLAEWTKRRRALAELYLGKIASPFVRPLPFPQLSESVWHLFPVLVREGLRDRFQADLFEIGIQTSVHYPRLIPDQPAMQEMRGFVPGNSRYTVAESICRGVVSIPMYPLIRDDEVETCIASINQWQPT